MRYEKLIAQSRFTENTEEKIPSGNLLGFIFRLNPSCYADAGVVSIPTNVRWTIPYDVITNPIGEFVLSFDREPLAVLNVSYFQMLQYFYTNGGCSRWFDMPVGGYSTITTTINSPFSVVIPVSLFELPSALKVDFPNTTLTWVRRALSPTNPYTFDLIAIYDDGVPELYKQRIEVLQDPASGDRTKIINGCVPFIAIIERDLDFPYETGRRYLTIEVDGKVMLERSDTHKIYFDAIKEYNYNYTLNGHMTMLPVRVGRGHPIFSASTEVTTIKYEKLTEGMTTMFVHRVLFDTAAIASTGTAVSDYLAKKAEAIRTRNSL